ncbi:MAG: hypothetical protein QXS51_01660 [Thermoproteota archaeon]
MKTEHSTEVGKFLYCSSLLEEEVAKTYRHLAESIRDKDIKCFLNYISDDSHKHAKVLMVLSEHLTSCNKPSFEECEKVLGSSWRNLMEKAKMIQEEFEIDNRKLVELIDGLVRFEGVVAEEYLTVLSMKTIELMAKESELNIEPYKIIFEWIVEDEKRHEQILKLIKNLVKVGQ